MRPWAGRGLIEVANVPTAPTAQGRPVMGNAGDKPLVPCSPCAAREEAAGILRLRVIDLEGGKAGDLTKPSHHFPPSLPAQGRAAPSWAAPLLSPAQHAMSSWPASAFPVKMVTMRSHSAAPVPLSLAPSSCVAVAREILRGTIGGVSPMWCAGRPGSARGCPGLEST